MLELQELADGKIWNMKHAKRAIRSILYTFVLQLIHTTDCISVLQTGQRNRDTRPYRLLLLPLPMAAPPSRIICCRQWIHQAIPPLPMTNPFARPICDTRVHTLDTAAPMRVLLQLEAKKINYLARSAKRVRKRRATVCFQSVQSMKRREESESKACDVVSMVCRVSSVKVIFSKIKRRGEWWSNPSA